MFRKAKTAMLTAVVVLAASLTSSSVTTLTTASAVCGVTTPPTYLPAGSPSGANPAAATAVATYKSQHDTVSSAERMATAAGGAWLAQKTTKLHQARLNLGCGTCASNVVCGLGFAYIKNLNHQDEGGSGTWCGPAVVSMIALTEPGPSNVTQQTARDWITNYQGYPVESGGTSVPAFVAALNHFVAQPNLGWDFYGFAWVDYYPTSQQRADYHNRLVGDVYVYGYALGGDTWEVNRYPHLPGHPTNLDILHYIEIGGYDQNTGKDYFSDPATGVPEWGSNVPPYSWFDEYTLVTILGGRGYAW